MKKAKTKKQLPQQSRAKSFLIYLLKAGFIFEVLSVLYFLTVVGSYHFRGPDALGAGIIWAIVYALLLPVLGILSLVGAKFVPFFAFEKELWGQITLAILNLPLIFLALSFVFPNFVLWFQV